MIISISEFPAQAHPLTHFGISGEQVHVFFAGQRFGLRQMGDAKLHLIKWQAVHVVPVAKLKRTQSQGGNRVDQSSQGAST
jgi:hypothetical protein